MYDPVFLDPLRALPNPLEPDAAAAPTAAAAAAALASAVPPSIIPASFVGVFIGSLRNIARAAACSCVSVSRGTFDGFLGLPRRL